MEQIMIKATAFRDKTVAVDTMVFIYLFDKDPRFYPAVSALFESAEKGACTLITSTISIVESLSLKRLEEKSHIIDEIGQFFRECVGLRVYSVDGLVAEEAARIRRNFPVLRTPDALQLAVGLLHEADAFMTHDEKILRLPSFPLKRISP